jgi:hypothetical protein
LHAQGKTDRKGADYMLPLLRSIEIKEKAKVCDFFLTMNDELFVQSDWSFQK